MMDAKLIEELEELREQNRLLRAALATVAPEPPKEFAELLGSYTTLIVDKGCREPIGWGFRIVRKLTDEEAAAMKRVGDIDWIGDGEYGLIIRWLTEDEAKARYGAPTEPEYGPKGGFRQIVYGDKAFNHRKMKPRVK